MPPSPRTAPLILALLLLAPAACGQEGPRRIVSLNLCTDELVLRLAERERVASVSYFAADPAYSPVAAESAGLHLNRGSAEEVLALAPDLILTSRFSATAAVGMLRRLGREVHVLDFPATLEDSFGQIREVAELLGVPGRGEALIAGMREDVEAARRLVDAGQRGKLAVFFASNGYSYGSGTLRDDFLARLGWRNLAAEAGMDGPAPLSMEALLRARPDYLLVNTRDVAGEHLAAHRLKHPALRKAFREEQVLELPDNLFQCAGPALATAYRRLAGQLAGLPSRPAGAALADQPPSADGEPPSGARARD